MKSYRYYESRELLIIDDSVIEINNNEFGNGLVPFYSRISKIKLSKNLEVIGNDAFCCIGLKQLSIPSKVKIIGESAFENNNQLSGKIVFPDSLIFISKKAFRNCSIDSVEVIGECQIDESAFDNNVKIIRRKKKELKIAVEKEESILEKIEKDRQKVLELLRRK